MVLGKIFRSMHFFGIIKEISPKYYLNYSAEVWGGVDVVAFSNLRDLDVAQMMRSLLFVLLMPKNDYFGIPFSLFIT